MMRFGRGLLLLLLGSYNELLLGRAFVATTQHCLTPTCHSRLTKRQKYNDALGSYLWGVDGRRRLAASLRDDLESRSVESRLGCDDQFERWRFLQKLLEGEVPPSDVEDLLLIVLDAYREHGPTDKSSNNSDENGGNASPVLTREQKDRVGYLIDGILTASDGVGDSRFLHMLVLPPVDYVNVDFDVEREPIVVKADSRAIALLEQIEKLLPDEYEEDEAHKSAWDVVIDLHGRESVKFHEQALQLERENGNEEDGVYNADNLQWRTQQSIVRLLLHFDFLTKGILKDNSFQ
mmetsp:Transcript_18819/g.44089  ORF Transcript_18819/g.44089 Transcript_18819/m.44089 type:complete len:292 (-) Transcript_18819:13-888(-)